MKYKLNLKDFDIVKVKLVDNNKILLLKKDKKEFFLKLAKTIIVNFDKDSLYLVSSTLNINDLELAMKQINFFIKNLNNEIFKKKLILDGLGLKVLINDNTLNFKLGYSHIISFPFPNELKRIRIKKKKITLESTDKIKIGNFAKKIYNLRSYDTYKVKGFSFLGVAKKLKEIKKK